MIEEQVEPKRRGRRPALDLNHMVEAPKDGKPIWLYETETERLQAVWRNTRRYDSMAKIWVSTGFWAKRNSGGIPIGFAPLGWRHVEGWDEV